MPAEAAHPGARRLLLWAIQRCKRKVRAPLQPAADGQCVQGQAARVGSWGAGRCCSACKASCMPKHECSVLTERLFLYHRCVQDSLMLKQQQHTAARLPHAHLSQGAKIAPLGAWPCPWVGATCARCHLVSACTLQPASAAAACQCCCVQADTKWHCAQVAPTQGQGQAPKQGQQTHQ